MVYEVWDVAISGVFALYKLELSASSVSGILFECAVGSSCVADGSNNVLFVVGGSVLCWQDVFSYDAGGLSVCVFVVLESLLFRMCDGREVGWSRVVCFGYVFPEVGDWMFSHVYSDDWPAASDRFL